MKKLTAEKKILLAFLLLGLLCALILCGIRMGIEMKNDSVCIAMPEADLQRIAEDNGLPDAKAAADALGVQIMDYALLKTPGMLVENTMQDSAEPYFGDYVPDGENTRVFLMEGRYAQRYAYLGYPGEKPVEDMLYRAVTDRNIRLLYLRLIETVGGTEQITELNAYASVIEGLSKRIAAHGLTISDAPSALLPYTPNAVLQYLTAVGVICAALWLLLCVFPRLPRKLTYALLLLGASAAAALLRLMPELFTAGFAFAAATAAPCLSLAVMCRYTIRAVPETKLGELGAYGKTLLAGFGIALAGGLMVAALLSGSKWLLSVENFRGVKLSQLLPIVFAAFLYLRDICHPKELVDGKICLTVAGVLVFLLCVAFFLFRTGQTAADAVSVAEQHFRAWLENVLIVRPRTKEFCIGWPCLALGMAAVHRGYRRLAAPFCLFTSPAVSSVVNSFCHSRAPIWLSSVRGILGALIGCAVGLVLLSLLTSLPLRKPKRTEEKEE